MSQLNIITQSRKGKHLTYEERIKLEALYKMGLKSSHIAEQIGGCRLQMKYKTILTLYDYVGTMCYRVMTKVTRRGTPPRV